MADTPRKTAQPGRPGAPDVFEEAWFKELVGVPPEAVVRELTYVDPAHFPSRAFVAAAARPDMITPYLLAEIARSPEEIASRIEKAPYDNAHYVFHVFAFYFLALFAETRAWGPMLRFFSRPGDLALDITGDMVTEDLPMLLAEVWDGDIEPLRRLILDTRLSPFVRSAGMSTLWLLLHDEKVTRDEAVAIVDEALEASEEERDPTFWSLFLMDAAQFQEPSLKARILARLDRVSRIGGRLDPGPEDIEATYGESREEIVGGLRHYERLDNLSDYMAALLGANAGQAREAAGSAGEREAMAALEAAAEAFDPAAPRTPLRRAKVGRNDPCPCGSGKKYKKCCLRTVN